jgi:serine O-acetyltransferase
MFKHILEEIDAVFARDPAARSRLEVFLCYPGFHAMVFHRLAHKLWRRDFKLLARWISLFSRFITGIEIHPGAKIGRHFFIDHGMGVVIGETSTIGDDVTIYHDVTLGGTSFSKGIRHPQIGNNVIIGAGAQVLGPIQVGDGARIGSNAVVVKDVPQGATMVGVPAHALESKVVSITRGFEAYGTPSEDDPMLKTLEKLSRQVEELQTRIGELEAQNQDLAKTAERWEGKK